MFVVGEYFVFSEWGMYLPSMTIPDVENNQSDRNDNAATGYRAHAHEQWQGNRSQVTADDCSVLRDL